MEEEEAPYYIERAKGGRAACKSCKQPCQSGELRIAKLAVGQYGEGRLMKMWHHIDCFMKVLMKQRPATRRIQSMSDVGNFSNLSPEDKISFLKTLNEMEVDYANKNNLDVKVFTETISDVKSKDVLPSKNNNDVDHDDNKFKTFCNLCMKIAKNDKHLDKTAIVSKFFTEGTDKTGFKGDVALWCRFLLPGVIKRIYNVKNKQLVKLFAKVLKTSHDEMLTDLEQGNIGETLKKFYEKSRINQNVTSTLNVFEVDEFLNHLSSLTKEEEQIFHFNTIINRCSADDLKYLIYLINGDLRMNAGAKNILLGVHNDAYKIFQSSRDIDIVISRVMSSNDKGKTSSSPVKKQINADIIIMKPVLPMLAEACKSVQIAMEKCKNGMLSEIKYDGERVQVHKSGSEFRYYSRSLKPVLGHKIARFKDFIPKAFPHANDLILDSEILMIDTKDGKPLPFGTLGVHKKSEFKDAEVCLFVFDCIYYNGKSLVNEPMWKRRKVLEENISEVKNHVVLSEMKVIKEESELADMIIRVLKQGLEGLVLKDLASTYEPGKRHWLKVKKDYLFDGAMADCADLVVLGASYGSGKKGGMLSVFLMGCYDEIKDRWLTVTKVHTGLDDSTLASIQDTLLNKMTKISGDSSKVPSWLSCTNTVVPDFVANDPKNQPVWEILGTEFTKAAIHTADGISIRFPRINRIRDDKCWRSATSLKELKNLFVTSKSDIDLSLFDKYKKNTPESTKSSPVKSSPDDVKKATKGRIESNISDSDVLSAGPSSKISSVVAESKINNGESNPKKRKLDSDSDSFKEKKPSRIQKLLPKNPLPNIFNDCIIKFYSNDANLMSNPEIKEIMRYWKAYNGFEDKTDDGSEATHVIHFKNSLKHDKLQKSKYKFSKKARHVTIDWVKEAIMNQKLLDTNPYSVALK